MNPDISAAMTPNVYVNLLLLTSKRTLLDTAEWKNKLNCENSAATELSLPKTQWNIIMYFARRVMVVLVAVVVDRKGEKGKEME